MKPVKLMVLIATVFCLVAAISCQHQDEESSDPIFVKMTIQLDSRNYQMAPDYFLSSGTSSAMISAVPASVLTVSGSTDLSSAYDRQMLSMTDNTVTLSVPLETSIRLVKAAYLDELIRANILANSPTPLFIGLSDAFTITSETTAKSVEVVMQEVVAVASITPVDAATDVAVGTTVAVTFNHTMNTASVTTNTGSTECTGSLQLSANSFSSCITMAASPVASSSDQIFTITPTSNLANSTAHQIKVTADVQSFNLTALESVTTASFTTAVLTTELIGGTIQGNDLSLSGVVTYFAGSGVAGNADLTGTSAQFNGPYAMTTNGTKLWVAEYDGCTILEVVIATGQVTTIAGTDTTCVSADGTGTGATFNLPSSLTTDGTSLWVTDSGGHVIRQLRLSDNVVTTIAGGNALGGSEVVCSGSVTANCKDGTGLDAEFRFPYGITHHNNFLYVADRDNNRIRKINLSNFAVTTLSGEGTAANTNGAAGVAQFNSPMSVSTNGTNLYVTDFLSYYTRSVSIADGTAANIAGDGTTPTLDYPKGIGTDGTTGYISEWGSSTFRIQSVPLTGGSLTLLAGAGSGCSDGTGSAARFSNVKGIVTNGTSLFVADRVCHRIFKID